MADDYVAVETAMRESFLLWNARERGGAASTALGSSPPSDADLLPLRDAIGALDSFNEVSNWWIWSKGKQLVVTAEWLSRWAFPGWLGEDNVPDAIVKLQHLLAVRSTSISYMTAIWGAETRNTIELNEISSLHRFEDLKFAAADDFKNESFGGPARFLGAYSAAVAGPPTLILCIRAGDFPFLSNDAQLQNQRVRDLYDQAELACLCLVVFGIRRPIIDISWHEYDDELLNYVTLDRKRFWRMPEIIPLSVQAGQIDAARYVDMHRRLMSLQEAKRRRYIISMKRFELSLARREHGNEAIDLCISLEQLLGSGDNAPISWTNGLRCAGLIGVNAESRRLLRDNIESIYLVRNRFVHGGSIEALVKTKRRGEITVVDLISQVRNAYCETLQKLISMEREPDWFELETNGGLI